jgi:hypothetical protein
MAYFDSNDPEADSKMRSLFGPQQVDHTIRQAIQCCWMALPADRRSADGIETEMRRLLDRALRDLREDWQSFGFPEAESG